MSQSNRADIRWQQRLANYHRVLTQLSDAVTFRSQRPLSSLEQQGLIKAFELTQELGCNTMKDYLNTKAILRSLVLVMQFVRPSNVA